MKRKLKRKSPEHSGEESELKKSPTKKKKLSKSKSVSFNEEVTVLNEKQNIKTSTQLLDASKEAVKKAPKAKKPKKKEEKKKLESDKLKLKKSNKANSTSRISLHADETAEFDQDDFNKSKKKTKI